MATANTVPQQTSLPNSFQPSEASRLHLNFDLDHVESVLKQVQERITPVWPLKDYVAVNPYAGFADQKFLAARNSLQAVSDIEMLMRVDYYREQFAAGTLRKAHINTAVDELVADKVVGAERIDVNQVVALLQDESHAGASLDANSEQDRKSVHRIRTFVDMLDHHTGSDWSRFICEEVSKHCAAHYDQGQAIWKSPWQESSLYEAWRQAAQYDRTFAILGVAGLRQLVSSLPPNPHAAVVTLLRQLKVPTSLWADYLYCEALATPGWSAWTNYHIQMAERQGERNTDFAGLLAMRLAYSAILCRQCDFHVDWNSFADAHYRAGDQPSESSDEDVLRYALLRASEVAFRNQLLDDLANDDTESPGKPNCDRRLAQLVFCIDVRSERIRRNLEAVAGNIETFGFAGFFGLPIEFVRLGENQGSSQVPVLISPQFTVYEELTGVDANHAETAIERRSTRRFLRKAWKDFQNSAASCFAFVETTGLFYAIKLFAQSAGFGQTRPTQFDGIEEPLRQRLAPVLPVGHHQDLSLSEQADMAESILRGIGIVDGFARSVVLCGHASRTENNPLQAGLDCGACGGHSGEVNSRLAAKLLNHPSIRQALRRRGIEIPDDTHFVAALHNTTTDELEFFDTYDVPASHRLDLLHLQSIADSASQRTRSERLAQLPGPNADDLFRRSSDWSEVRPEWGLAGNAAFVAAPRTLTESVSLEGRSFLHSYDYRNDPEFAVLEQIMTAPLVVAHLINMQYYASTVEPSKFGSGTKTVHNVVGRFGLFSGNGGDLMTGLPWQSIHDGQDFQHHPLRLLAIIAAPREAIQNIIENQELLANLLANGWLQLVAVEDNKYYRLTEQLTWDELQSSALSATACIA